jgi:hypothetical protein
MRFILNGKAYEKTGEDFERAMADVQPEVPRRYYVVINGKKYPPKQVLAKVLDLGRIEFTTMAAGNILKRLGFKLQRTE